MARVGKSALAPQRMSDAQLWRLVGRELSALAPESRRQLEYADETRSIAFLTAAIGELHLRGQQLELDVARAGLVDGSMDRLGPGSPLTV